MSLAAAIASESEELTFTRYAAGTRTSGVYSPGSSSTFDASFAVQPLSPRELALLPEGSQTRATLKLYGDTQLQVASPATGRIGDRFTRNSLLWEITAEAEWSGWGGHYRYYASKVEA